MFGIKTKKTYIFALILGIIGVVVLCLKIFKVLPEKDMYTLLALIFLLSAFALYLRPKMKLMKAQTAILQEYREKLLTEMTSGYKKNFDLKDITFKQDENGSYHYKNVSFENLTFEEFKYVIKHLLQDFILIVYGVEADKGWDIKIETFTVKVEMNNGEILESNIVEGYKLVK